MTNKFVQDRGKEHKNIRIYQSDNSALAELSSLSNHTIDFLKDQSASK